MEAQRKWFDSEEKGYTDEETLAWLTEKLRIEKGEEVPELILGTDSQSHGHMVRFITVVCVYSPGKGGDYRFVRQYQERRQFKGNQQMRMFEEVNISLDLAQLLFDKLGAIPEIHIDASPKENGEFTSNFSEALSGMVKAYGFNAKLKPNAHVASSIADRHSK